MAVGVTEDLHLDVARLGEIALEEDRRVTERGLRLAARGLERVGEILGPLDDAHALAAAAGGGLDHHRVTDVTRNLDRALGRFDGVVPAGDGVDLGFVGQLLGGDLVAHGSNGVGTRANEGDAAARYFSVFNLLLTDSVKGFNFSGRVRRPPTDPVNALLSFIYSVLGKDISAALQGVGLDPQVGFLHQERPGRDSLALDLLEEFRAFIADRLVLTLLNRQQLKATDFVAEAGGAVKLKDDARKLVLQEYQSRKQQTIKHAFLGEDVEIGLLPYIQAMLLARHLRGDLAEYPPFFSK